MLALRSVSPEDLIFLDIETVRTERELTYGSPLFKSWEYKMQRNKENEDPIVSYRREAALHPEFAKIVVITIGRISGDTIIIKSYYNHNEKILLEEFTKDMNSFLNRKPRLKVVGFANNGFDAPFILKRCMVNQVKPCDVIDSSNRKPWEMPSIDLKEVWRSGSYSSASLINVCTALDIPSPKEDLSGAGVGEVYWELDDLDRIVAYCERDVEATANVFRRCRFEPLLKVELKDIDIKRDSLMVSLLNGGAYGEEEAAALKQMVSDLDDGSGMLKNILNAVTSNAKGAETKIKKPDVTKIFKEVENAKA
jgi:hypothetical protein